MAEIIAIYPSKASARRALAQFSMPPDGWLEIEEIETVEDTEQPEWWIVAYPTEGEDSLAFEEWVIANQDGGLSFTQLIVPSLLKNG